MSFRDVSWRATKAVWSGPFATGPLVQPISLGAALLRILEVVWKFGIAVMIAGGGAGALYSIRERVDGMLNPTIDSQLAWEAHFDPESCYKTNPISVTVRNRSNRALESAYIHIVVRKPGRSTDLNYYENSPDWDAIVQPGKAFSLCYPLPTTITEDPKTLEYSVNATTKNW